LNSEKIWTIGKNRGKRYKKYGSKKWKDSENIEER
jgi:hypothetical protein